MRNYIFQTYLWAIFLCPLYLSSQTPASVKEYKKRMKTYMFSDPDPVPHPQSRIYPYFRFDGYTDTPTDKEWTVVELENDYIKVQIMPEIGGKIWTAIEKSTEKPFLYNNEVVKFRDVAMRGPWTSGGIEANYGIIGHTPNSVAPVDYLIKNNEDGSASCFIGWLDLLTRTWWRIEIKLERDKAYFTTHSLWYNATPLEQPYYHWMNVGIKSAGNLEFIYDGSRYLGHDGELGDWKINSKNGKNVSFYNQNDFGTYKSYHVFGKYTDFFGGYWHDEDFGMGRYAPHDDKAGKKIWIWGLSQQGMIWEKLLTDNNGQYVEVQSGRLFNQAAEGSNLTPFKQKGFAPYSTDTWTEYWFPVKNTKGFVKANDYAVLNVKDDKIWLMALQPINDILEVFDKKNRLFNQKISLKPMEVFQIEIPSIKNREDLLFILGDRKLIYETDPKANTLNRPVEAPQDFDNNSAYGLWLQGKQFLHMREYAKADEKLRGALTKEPYFIPALCDMAQLEYRRMHYADALNLVRKALSINTYDGQANYLYGLINIVLKNNADAKDGFDIAAMSVEYRSAAYTELAKLYFRENAMFKAYQYTEKSLENNTQNIEALQLKAMILKVRGEVFEAQNVIDKCLALNPLNHIARAGKMFIDYDLKKDEDSTNAVFKELIKNEMLSETVLECAAYYQQVPLAMDWSKINPSADIPFYTEYNQDKMLQSTEGYFPFRPEQAAVLEEAIKKNNHWKIKYYLGLIKWHFGDIAEAQTLFKQCENKPDYAPFYAARADLFKSNSTQFLTDMERATALDPKQWRYGKALIQYFIEQKNAKKALEIAEKHRKTSSDNYYIGLLYAKTLLLNERYTEGVTFMQNLKVLPNEGATDGRILWKEMNLMQAASHIKSGKYTDALKNIQNARIWLENLGVGKPYQEDIDERLEDYMEAICHENMGKKDKAMTFYEKVKTWKNPSEKAVFNDILVKNLNQKSALKTALSDAALGDNENLRVLQKLL